MLKASIKILKFAYLSLSFFPKYNLNYILRIYFYALLQTVLQENLSGRLFSGICYNKRVLLYLVKMVKNLTSN